MSDGPSPDAAPADDLDVRVVHEGSWIHPGGAARVARELARAFDAPVTVGHTPYPEFWEGLDVEFPFQDRFQQGVSGWLSDRSRFRSVAELLRATGFRGLSFDERVVITSGTAAKWFVPRWDQAHVHYCHVPPPRFYAEPTGGLVDWLLTTGVGVVDSHFADFCTAIVANSEFTAERVRTHYRREEAPVLNPPISVDRFHNEPPATDDPYFVMVGRLTEMKRADVVARAFADLDDARLVLVGDGPLADSCQARENVTVHERVDDDELQDLIARSVGGIAFARLEHCGMTPKEFQAAGKPVVVPREPNLVNHVEDGATGVVVDPDEAGVREGVRRVLATEWDVETIQSAAADWSVESFHRRARELLPRLLGDGGAAPDDA